MTAGCSVVGGAEGFGAGGTGYSTTGAAEHSAAGGTGAEDAENSVAGVVVHFGAAFLVGFVNFHPSPPCVLHLLHIWGSVFPMSNSLQLVWGQPSLWGLVLPGVVPLSSW